MTDSNQMPGKTHQSSNIRRFREMYEEEALCHELADDWSQKKISLLEQKKPVETIPRPSSKSDQQEKTCKQS